MTIPPAQPDGPQDPPPKLWYVLVEYSNQGQAKPPTLIDFPVRDGIEDYEQAIAEAERQAFQFEPPDPFSPKGRRVFRSADREFLTIIEGAMSTFHFTTRVAQFLGKA